MLLLLDYCKQFWGTKGIHSTITVIDYIFEHVGELEDELAVLDANLFEVDHTQPSTYPGQVLLSHCKTFRTV